MKPPPAGLSATVVLCLALGQFALPSAAFAADTPPALDSQQQAFVTKATADDALQISLAKVALKRSQAAQVEALARRIIDDHQALDRKLTRFFAARKAQGRAHGMPSSDVTKARLQLQQLQGDALDKGFAQQMTQEHQKAIPLYERAAKADDNKTLQAIASHALPMLRQHLQAAQALAAK